MESKKEDRREFGRDVEGPATPTHLVEVGPLEYVVGEGATLLKWWAVLLAPWTYTRGRVTGDWPRAILVGLIVLVLYSLVLPIARIIVAPWESDVKTS